jgi:hypothetical protein
MLGGTAALALCLALQSCFTAGLWASPMRPREKAALTPLSLTLDAVTLPVQLALVHDGHGHHHHFGGRRGGSRRRCR